MPALPNPAIARPMIRALEFGATPQMRLPSSKSEMAARKTCVVMLQRLQKAETIKRRVGGSPI
jgi:hypothetical protein